MKKKALEISHNKHPDSQKPQNSRRDFIKSFGKLTIAGIATTVIPACSPEKPQQNTAGSPEKIKFITTHEGEQQLWKNIRSQFVLRPDIIQMNTGTEGAMTRSVIDSLYQHSLEFASNPIDSAISNDGFELKQKKNCSLTADFLGADEEEIVLTTNTTEGIHTAINGLDIQRGDEIITTLHEHGAMSSPLHVLKDRKGLVIKKLALPTPATSRQILIDIFERAITVKTRVICLSHINYTTGLQMPLKEICEIAKHKGIITIIDGAHSIGMIDFNLHDLGCDFYACSGHKWLNGPPGTGILYIRDAKNNPCKLWPVLTEVYSVKKAFPISKLLQMRGQQNTPAFCAMIDAMNFQKEIGKKRIEKRVLLLNTYLKEKIAEIWGEKYLLTPLHDSTLCSGMASFIPYRAFEDRYKRHKFSYISKTLRDKYKTNIRDIWFRDQLSDKKNTFVVRISTHIFNTHDEIDKVLHSINEITKAI